MKGQEPRSNSSCAACKFLKRRCAPNCIFAPHFRADEPKKFAKVHKVFGASNVTKILNEVPEEQREDAANSLVFEAEVRLRDPVYGCIGAIASLQDRMVQLQHDLAVARACLAHYSYKPSPLFLVDHNTTNMGAVSDLSVCSGLVENFSHNSFGLDQRGGYINGLVENFSHNSFGLDQRGYVNGYSEYFPFP